MIPRLTSLLVCLAVTMASCAQIKTAGLRTVHPPVELPNFSTRCSFVEVSDLQPTFEWLPLSRTPWADAGDSEPHPPLENITYELRIWRRYIEDGERLVVSAIGLPEARYEPSEPLPAGTEFFWSVRAHFTVAGRQRVSEWSLAGLPMRAESVPNESCLKFKTP